MALGPVEYLIVGFPGDPFRTDVVPALSALIERGTIRVVDLAFVVKDRDGSVTILECDEVEGLAEFASLPGEVGDLVKEEDLLYAAESLEPGTSAMVIVWEDTWATDFATAIRSAGGEVLEGARIPAALIEDALRELATA